MFINNEKLHEYPEYASYRKMLMTLETGFVGSTTHEAVLVGPDVSEEALNEYSWQAACEHAGNYGIYPLDDEMTDEEIEESSETFTDNIAGWFKPFEEKHEGKVSYSHGFQWTVIE